MTALDSEGEGSTRGVNALALAGPVPNPIAGFRYSADYTEPSFPPKSNVSFYFIIIYFYYYYSLALQFNYVLYYTAHQLIFTIYIVDNVSSDVTFAGRQQQQRLRALRRLLARLHAALDADGDGGVARVPQQDSIQRYTRLEEDRTELGQFGRRHAAAPDDPDYRSPILRHLRQPLPQVSISRQYNLKRQIARAHNCALFSLSLCQPS